jgi:Carboxypeptidase regulatory-like domain
MEKSIRNAILRCTMIFGVFLSMGTGIYAQAPDGTITGTVTDSSGGVVPNARVTVVNKANNTTRATTANATGLFSAPALPPGDYEVRAEMEGFRTTQRDAPVVAGSTTTVDMALTVGGTREVVTVEAATAQINYESHNVAGVIARESIEDLPLNGRSSFQLAALEPGVSVTPGTTSNFNSMFTITILGGGGVAPRFTLDGGIINDENDGSTGTSLNFSQELVQEFQLASANFDPSTGIGTAGAINIVTRSGSNDFHGSAYYFYRDHNMAAYPALQRSAVTPNPFFQRKNPGIWFSGPVLKNKLFFFASYEHMAQTQVINDQNDLPSLQPLNGIFPSPLHYNWISVRFDYRLSDKHNLFVRHTHDGNQDVGPYSATGNPSAWVINSNWSDQDIFGITSSLTPNIVNEARGSYHFWQNQSPDAPASLCVLPCVGAGLPGIVSMIGSGTFTNGAGNYGNGPQQHQMRSYEVSDTVNWQRGNHRIRVGVDFEILHSAYTPYDKCFPACLSLFSVEQAQSLGKAFPAGAFANVPSVINSTAALEALPVYSLPANASSAGVGIGNGSWPGTYQHNVGGNNTRVHPWVADTWKATQNLTVNYGLGYDIETGLFPSNMPLPQYLAPILNGQTGGVASGVGTAAHTNKLDFAPMFGFAWALGKNKKTVIRGGAGLYWDTVADWYQMVSESSVGPAGNGRVQISASAFTNIFPDMYYQSSTGVKPLPIGASLPLAALSTLSLGNFLQILNQQVPVIQAQLNSYGTVTSGPYSVSGIQVVKQGVEMFPSKYPFLRSYQASIGIQRELPGNMVLTADFARRQGENANLGELDLNRTARSADGLPPVIPTCTTIPDFNPNDQCSTGSITFWSPEGRTVYDGLLVKLQKRFSHHYQFVVSYAFQKNLVEVASVNLNNYMSTYGPNLARQNLNIAGSVNLPYGFKLSLNSSLIAAAPATPIISGIDLNGSGNTLYPLTLAVPGLQYNCFNYSCGQTQLAAAVSTFNSTLAGTKALNGATVPTITLPKQYHLGAPVIDQDMRVTKEFAYKERYRLQVFGEFFNLLNIGNLSYGNLTLNSSSFGLPTARVGQGSTFSSGGPRAIQVGARINF